MNYKFIISTLCIVFLSIKTFYCQEIFNNQINESQKESYVLFNITTPIDLISPRFRAGYIYQLSPKWRFGIAAGYGNNFNRASGESRIWNNYQVWEIRPQLYYMFDPENKKRPYFSAELFYIHHTDTFTNNSYNPENNNGVRIHYDQADYKRQKYGVNFTFGFMFKIIGEFGLNPYAGMGISARTVSFSKIINPTISDYVDDDDEFGFGSDNYLENEGTVFGVNFTFGANLFYRF